MSEGLYQSTKQEITTGFEVLDDILEQNFDKNNQQNVITTCKEARTPKTPTLITEDQQGIPEEENPQRTRPKTMDNNQPFSNVDSIRNFMDILDGSGDKEAPKPDQLQIKKLMTCPACDIITKDMLEMLRHFSRAHYKPRKQEGKNYFCYICNIII